MRAISFLFLGFLFANVLFADPQILLESPGPVSDVESDFRKELALASRRAILLRQPKDGGFSPVKKINDSYRLMSEAIGLLAETGDLRQAVVLLEKAIRRFGGNRLAYLLLGYALEKLDNIGEAGRAYQNYYRNSLTVVPIENKLIRSSSVRIFNRYVESRLEEWGFPVPAAHVSRRVHTLRSLSMLEYSEAGQKLNLFLSLLTVGGFILLLLGRAAQIEFTGLIWYFILRLYGLIVAAYILWAAHFFLGLPFWKNPETEFKIFFAAGIVLIVAMRVAGYYWKRYRQDRVQGEKRCPKCGEMTFNLAAQCSRCRHKF